MQEYKDPNENGATNSADGAGPAEENKETTGAEPTVATTEKDMHHRLAMNVIGTNLDGVNDLKDKIDQDEYKDVKEAYTKLGESIIKFQDSASEGKIEPSVDGEIKDQIETLCNTIKANNKKKSNEAATNGAMSMASDTGPNPGEIIKKFDEAKSDENSTLFISTENRAQVIAEYKNHIEKNPIQETKISGWEKAENSVGFTQDDQKKTVTGVARSENDGRLMARKVAKMNGYNPNKKYHISLGKFKKEGSEKQTKATWYELKAAVGYMREHRKYGATAGFSLGKGDAMTLASWATNQEENAVNLQHKVMTVDISRFANPTQNWKSGGSRVLDTIDVAGELLINEARELALKDNPRLDTSNLAALNVATYLKLNEAMEELGGTLGDQKDNMFSQDTVVGKVEKAMAKENATFLDRSSVKKVIEAAEKSMKLNMGMVEINQLNKGFDSANKTTTNANTTPDNATSTKPFEVEFEYGAPLKGDSTKDSPDKIEHTKISFSNSNDPNGKKVFSEKEIKAEQRYTEKSALGTRFSIPSTLQSGADDVITSPYWATCALINHTWQSCKVLTKGAFAGTYATIMAMGYLSQKMRGKMAEGETFVDKALGSYGGGYKGMTQGFDWISRIGFKSASQYIRSLPGSLKQYVKSFTGQKELSITKGFMYIASGMTSNPLSVIYNSLPAVMGRSIKHEMNEIFYDDPNNSKFSPGEVLKQNITARDIIDKIKGNSFNLENMNVRRLVGRGIPDQAIEDLNKNRGVYNVLSKYDDSDLEEIMKNINDDDDTYKTNLRQAVIVSMGSRVLAMDYLKSSYPEKSNLKESRAEFANKSVQGCDQVNDDGTKPTEEQVKNNIKRSLLEKFTADMTNVEDGTGVQLEVKNDENGPRLVKEVTNTSTGTILTVPLNAENDLVNDIMENVSVTDDKGNIDMGKAAKTLETALDTTENKVLGEVEKSIGEISNTLKEKDIKDVKETIKSMSSDKPITQDSLVEMARTEIKDEKTSQAAINKATSNVKEALGVDNSRQRDLDVTQGTGNTITPAMNGA